ncbi:SCO2400 family protein, partial [Streptacidiphilus carbonis]|uniref:SCO2400 family protein n=1 Tax=Streptacidiphilus carbonis TaxID=105422 RepID=UPI0005A89530
MNYCSTCRRRLNGALNCPGCGRPAEELPPELATRQVVADPERPGADLSLVAPPLVDPPVAEPPASEPPVVDPPVVDPSVVDPAAGDRPTTELVIREPTSVLLYGERSAGDIPARMSAGPRRGRRRSRSRGTRMLAFSTAGVLAVGGLGLLAVSTGMGDSPPV